MTEVTEAWWFTDGRLNFDPPRTPRFPADATDDGLDRIARRIRNRVDEGEALHGDAVAARLIRAEQLMRFRLRMRYGAVDDHVGTDVYDRWYRLDESPTYRLARHMDCERARLGWSHVLLWPSVQRELDTVGGDPR